VNKKINYNALKKKYSNDGFIVIRNFLNSETIDEINNDLEKFVSKYIKSFKTREINFLDGNIINSIHNLSKWKWTSKIRSDIRLRKLVKNLLGESIVDFGAELFAKPAKTGLAVPEHQDNYYWCLNGNNAVTVWIALEKSNKANGGLYYYKKSQKLGILEHISSQTPGSSQMIKHPDSMQFFKKELPNLMPGDCMIHNCEIVHGSTANKSNNSRRGWTLRFRAKSTEIDKEKKKRYESDLNSQIKKRKRQ
tara:strand:- start:44039 stop:44788 length:750 start_codon:yes stop_codon:yes gene_type:complete